MLFRLTLMAPLDRFLFVSLLFLRTIECAPIITKQETKLEGFMPHCTKTAIVHGEMSQAKDHLLQSTIQLKLGLNETACFRLSQSNTSNTSLLYTVRLSSVEHHHPITQRYQFAIPLVQSSCICDCEGGVNHCDPETNLYGRCDSTQTLCYRTYHPNQPSVGCPAGETSELCCDVSLSPYKNWRFWAINIGQPRAFAIFDYRAYDWVDGYWRLVNDDQVTMRLDGATQTADLSKDTRMNIKVNGARLSNQLDSGMCFLREDEGDLRFGIPVNDIFESSLEKLGWFRLTDKGEWDVRKGDLKMNHAHFVKVLNCKEQKYTSSYDAEQFVALGVDGETERFNLGNIVEESMSWIRNIRVEDLATSRDVIVAHAEPNSIDVTLSMDDVTNIQFVHNSSAVSEFAGSILLDSQSNRFLNLSLYDASGILHGSCYASDSKLDKELAFSVYVSSIGLSDSSTIVPLPSNIDASRLICLKADDSENPEICHWLDFNSQPLPIDLSKVSWQEATGHCPGCNEITLSGLFQNLDPRKWLKGISSVSELVTVLIDAGFYLIIFFIVFTILQKCIFPAVEFCICPLRAIRK